MLKKRISKLTGLVSCQTAASCNALHQSSTKLTPKSSLAKSGTAINTICSSSGNLNYTTDDQSATTAFTISGNGSDRIDHTMIITSTEPRVVFQLPDNRRPSIYFANAAPTLRERVKGSPRFPHRIAPTSSLNALIDDKEIDDDNGLQLSHYVHLKPLILYPLFFLFLDDEIQSCLKFKSKWKSMEESSFTSTSSSSSTSAAPAISINFYEPINFIDTTAQQQQLHEPFSSTQDDDDDNDSIISVICNSSIPNETLDNYCD